MLHRGFTKFLAELPGGLQTALSRLSDDGVRHFFSRTFLSSTWYDAVPIVPLVEASASEHRVSADQLTAAWAHLQADEDFTGACRPHLSATTSELVTARIPKVISQLFDWGRIELVGVENGRAQLVRAGIPEPLGGWQAVFVLAYYESVLTLAGVRDPVATTGPLERDGFAHRVPLRRFSFEVRWLDVTQGTS